MKRGQMVYADLLGRCGKVCTCFGQVVVALAFDHAAGGVAQPSLTAGSQRLRSFRGACMTRLVSA